MKYGLYESDAAKIANAFHPTSALTSVSDDGELVITPCDLSFVIHQAGRAPSSNRMANMRAPSAANCLRSLDALPAAIRRHADGFVNKE